MFSRKHPKVMFTFSISHQNAQCVSLMSNMLNALPSSYKIFKADFLKGFKLGSFF